MNFHQPGPGALAALVCETLTPDRNYAIDSIRHPAEVEALRASGQPFKLIWVDAEFETRFARLQSRGRSGDPSSLADMKRLEDKGVTQLGVGYRNPYQPDTMTLQQKIDWVRRFGDEVIAKY